MISDLPRAWDLQFAKEVDRTSSTQYKIEPLVLMERAGLAVAAAALKIAAEFDSILVLAGTGNNGGDGLVAARELSQQGLDVRCIIVSRTLPARYSDSCRLQKQILESLSVCTQFYQYGILQEFRTKRCLIIDAILGIGFVPPLDDGPILDALKEAASLPNRYVIAVDTPSGLNANGWNLSCSLPADQTISFGGPKPCHLVAPSQKWCGKLEIADPGFPKSAISTSAGKFPPRLLIADLEKISVRSSIQALPSDAHKYDRGHVLVMGGSAGKWGAPILAGVAAARSGAGWISLATDDTPPESLVDADYPELTFEKVSTASELDAFVRARRVRAIIIGPGWMKQKLTNEFLEALQVLQSDLKLRIVLDAGATADLSKLLRKTPLNAKLSVATPHPGEWSKMFGNLLPTDQLSDFDQIFEHAHQCGVSLVYKSATPILFNRQSESNHATVICGGSGAVAKAGSGDVLCGVIAAHAMHCDDISDAVIFAFKQFHRAGRISALQRGFHGVMPSDILDHLGLAL
jgi:hydroxyethylthiazole kinase-like uncharacterized protein yjeF